MKKFVLTGLILLIAVPCFAYTRDWEYDTPAGSANANTIDTAITDFKKALGERLNNDHEWLTTDNSIDSLTAGDHRYVTMHNSNAVTAGTANTGVLHVEDVSSKAELFYMDEDSNDVQITSGGVIAYANPTVLTNLTTSGDVTVSETLLVYGTTTLTKAVTMNADLTLSDSLSIGGSSNRLFGAPRNDQTTEDTVYQVFTDSFISIAGTGAGAGGCGVSIKADPTPGATTVRASGGGYTGKAMGTQYIIKRGWYWQWDADSFTVSTVEILPIGKDS